MLLHILSFIDIHMMMRSFEFMALRYLEHSQTLIIPLYVYTWNKTTHLDGFAVYDIRTKYITRRYEIPHKSKWELLSRFCSPIVPFLPARCLVFDSMLTTILSNSVESTDLETGKNLWTLSLDNALNRSNCVR
jgi:hypothetical protein